MQILVICSTDSWAVRAISFQSWFGWLSTSLSYEVDIVDGEGWLEQKTLVIVNLNRTH